MKSGFSSSLPALRLLAVLTLPLIGCDQEAPKEPGTTFRDCNTCPEMVVISSGSFKMGDLSGDGSKSEKPVGWVHINYSFAVSKYEVTLGEFKSLMGSAELDWKDERTPAEMVSWYGAKEFVKKLSSKSGKEYRLLSEAEWEYMARAGGTSKYPWGIEIDSSKTKYNCVNEIEFKLKAGETHRCISKEHILDGTEKVGLYPPNAFGVYDTAGNVAEWVEDCWHENYEEAPSDGSAWVSEEADCWKRVYRGGTWFSKPWGQRSANRGWNAPADGSLGFGFRIARTLSQ